ncbi:disintegrin and metalloproteinase domain-containing protein 12-like [Huso huso]|uniref:Disintegrin and metalloproteinase domain-containing protein 12-like n=1 Tax=Huso huso TaxID=61971 RepID=A0ABR0ZCK3_HUSHU
MTSRRWKKNVLLFITQQFVLLTLTRFCDTVEASPKGTEADLSEPLRQPTSSNQRDHYETFVPSLLEGGQQKPINNLHLRSYPVVVKLLIEAEGEQLVLALEKNKGLFASHYTETHYLDDGSAVTVTRNSTVHCYYHGKVQGHARSEVSLSTCSGLRGFISLENKTYVTEPAKGATNGTHFIYRAENLNGPPGTCGHGFNISGITLDSTAKSFDVFNMRHKRDTQRTTKYVELIIVADNREFQRQGKDVEKVKQRLIEVANYVDKFYRPLNIRVALVGLEVWSDTDKCSITQDPFTTLHEFLDWRKLKLLPQKPHDNAQLVSGVYFQGTTIGMAPIMSMCTAEQSGGIVMDHSENPLGAAVTLAHELGHNFGMNHDTPERGCNCRVSPDKGGCIMTPSTGYPFPTVFSSCSKKDLDVSLEKGVGMCLFNMPEVKVLYGGQKCGNGYVEEAEECDCGDIEECTNPCCNATTCTLKVGAVCAHGQCCEGCKLKPAGTPCRDSSNACDLPEFCTGDGPHCPPNVYLHDGHSCLKVEGYCYNGICQTHEQQCITLWGQGAKPAPGICFERVNSAGDPYGNCGKNSKGSFAKCEIRDAECGKIQCQGGANRPVIGTNAVSIETNIPLQEGGRILCRGTHVYLGDDMPDPGLVLTGTKCGDGMMCLNRQCKNVSVFGIHECAGKCNGRGVCNNNKHCHCEANWSPPHCEIPGFGGSLDSGPMRLADNTSLTVGILVTLISLIIAGFIVCFKKKTLIRLLFTNKKTTIEKLRSVGPTRPSSPNQTNPAYSTSPSRRLPAKPHNSSIYKPAPHVSECLLPSHTMHSHSMRKLPLFQPVHISNPIPVSLGAAAADSCPADQIPQRVLPPLNQLLPSRQGLPVRNLLSHPSFRQIQETSKPSPPQKPLPADPLGRGSQLNKAPSTLPETSNPVPRMMQPVRPAPKHPPKLPKPNNVVYVK